MTLWIVLGMRIKWLMMVSEIDFVKASQGQFVDLTPVAAAVIVENYVNCVNTLLMFLRAFRSVCQCDDFLQFHCLLSLSVAVL